MQRNSSFFWDADSVHSESDDDAESSTIAQHVALDIGLDVDEFNVPSSSDQRRDKDDGPGGILQEMSLPTTDDKSPLLFSSARTNYGISESSRRLFKLRYSIDKAKSQQSIRFQVVIWYVGAVDVVLGHVPMRFRVSLFWNDVKAEHDDDDDDENATVPSVGWTMDGRMLAYQDKMSNVQTKKTINVPPLSILNAVNHDVIGTPEVAMLSEDTRLMRWTCMYSATVFQGENLRVDNFPHDRHDLVLKLGVLAHRRAGGIWDKSKWTLGLATEKDSQGTTRIPYGLLVDHVSIPDFRFTRDGFKFEFVPFSMGEKQRNEDKCLQVRLTVFRQSRHYDMNIVPLLGVLNVVAISCLPRNFDSATASTESMLSIAFVEIGIRLTVDSRLPSVPYQIKMQRVMNRCFWLICFLVLESNVNFFLVKKRGWEIATTDKIDLVAAIIGLIYTIDILTSYYGNVQKELATDSFG